MSLRISRRQLLVGAATATALGLSGCSSALTGPLGFGSPDEEVRTKTAAAKQELIALYNAVLAAHPSLQTELSEIRAHHVAHRNALEVDDLPTVPAPQVPKNRAAALKTLRKAERNAAQQRIRDCGACTDAEVAVTMAHIAAAEGAHAALLERTH